MNGKGISLDACGNRPVYNAAYREMVQQSERMEHAGFLAVARKTETIEDMGRVRRNQMKIVKDEKKEIIALVEGKAWDIEKCRQRVNTNLKDGDARYILGGYYLLEEDYLKAVLILQSPQSNTYQFFSLDQVYEWLGYAYYKLGQREKGKSNTKIFTDYIYKEQDAYLSGSTREYGLKGFSFLMYMYALTFIDLGLYIESFEKQFKPFPKVMLPKAITIRTSREAYEQSLKVLLSFSKPSNMVFESRAFVYKKLGVEKKAVEERKQQGVRAKLSLYEQQRKPIRKEILDGLEMRNILTAARKVKYEKGLKLKYQYKSKKAQMYLDSMINEWSRGITVEAVQKNKAAQTLPHENKIQLMNEVGTKVKRRLKTELYVIEVEYVWKRIEVLFSKEEYSSAKNLLKQYNTMLSKSHRAKDLPALKKKILSALQEEEKRKEEKRKEEERKRRAEEARRRQLAERAKRSSKPPTPKPKAAKTAPVEKKESDKEKEKPQEPKKVERKSEPSGEMAMYQRVGLLIDDLIAKKDYVGAYRGIIAYEKILKAHFNPKEIERNKSELEKVIREEYGDKYFKNLRKDLNK